MLDNVIGFYKENNLYDEYKDELEYIYVRYAFCSSLLRIVKIKDENVQSKLLELTWNKVNGTFPNWKKNQVLKSKKDLKSIYLKTINKFTFDMYSTLFSLFSK